MRFVRYNMPLAICGAIALGLGLYLWLIPWSSTSIGPFYGPKALTNPLLAAEKFLEAHGVTIERRGDASNLDFTMATSDVLLMTNQSGDFTKEQVEDLFQWIEAGGTVIYHPVTLYAEDGKYFDRVLAHRSLRLAVNPQKDRLHTPSPDVHHSDVSCPESKNTTTISLNEDQSLQVDLAKDVALMSMDDDEPHAILARIEPKLGSGRFVVLTSLRQWRNNLIQCNDNARFLREVVVGSSERKIFLAWLDGAESQPWHRHLWQWFPYSVTTLMVLLIWWLWNRIPREQPVTWRRETRENPLEDYLLRKAIFRWNSTSTLEQLDPLRSEILGRTGLRHSYAESDYERLSQATGESVEEIKSALNSNAWTGERELIKLVATLSRIRGKG